MSWLLYRMRQHAACLWEWVEVFAASIPEEHSRYSSRLLKHARTVKTMTHEWDDFPLRGPLGDIRTSITACMGYAELERDFAQRHERPHSPEQNHTLMMALRLARCLSDDVDLLSQRQSYAWFIDFKAEHAPEVGPILISHLLAWPTIYQLSARIGVSLTLPAEQSFPPVLYHPRFTGDIWENLITHFALQLRGDPHLYITPLPEADGIALHLTKRDIFMTPAQWDLLLQRQREYLYEFRSSLMPLTWDEGHGQGVILRLPWANQNEGPHDG